jgi:hypothetical protein
LSKLAWHFLKDDWRAASGDESAWTIGERREVAGPIRLCARGYLYCDHPSDALEFAVGHVCCRVEVEDGDVDYNGKGVSSWRRLIAGANVESELRLFAVECAERALTREREQGREPHADSWRACEVARGYAMSEATADEMSAAESAARSAARSAAESAAWSAARSAAWSAAESAERDWQRGRLAEMLTARLALPDARAEAVS